MIKLNTTHNASYKKKAKKINIHDLSTTRRQSKNNGGFLGGLGYVGGSIAAGVAGVGEGIVDLFAAAGAAISGDTEYAKYVFKDNQAGEWHQSLTEDYNPGKVMNFLGDVGHGLGQSSVFLLNAIPGLGQLGTAAFFTGIIGQGISNAADKTGDVGFKEVAYGVGTGVTEGILETYLGGAAKAAGSIGKGLVGNVAKNAVRRGLAKEILTGAGEEFLEEFVGEYTDVFWQRTTGVDKNASTSLKNAIYSGLVGAVSGGLSVGSTSVIKYGANQQRGKRIIQSGNAQTLVNTATSVADKLAGSGTDFKKADEWITALRGDVDAYNKLSPEQKAGAQGQTILGEMQAALAFAELQASFAGVQAKIENSDESTRAAFAEYINQTVDKSKRNKDYTAEDIAKNTDNVSWQIAVLDYVNGIADIDGAIAFEEAAQARVAGEKSKGRGVINNDETVIDDGEAIVDGGETVVNKGSTVVNSGEAVVEIDSNIKDGIKNRLASSTGKLLFDGMVFSLSTKTYNTVADIASRYIFEGDSEINAVKRAVDETVSAADVLTEGNKLSQQYSKPKMSKLRGAIINAYRDSFRTEKKDAEATARREKYNELVERTRAEKEAEKEALENKRAETINKIIGQIQKNLNGVSIDEGALSKTVRAFVQKYKQTGDAKQSAKMTVKDQVKEVTLSDGTVVRSSDDHGKAISKYRKTIVDTLVGISPRLKFDQNTSETSDKTVEGKTEEKSAENENNGEAARKTAQETVNEPKISEAKEALTDNQRKARAIETARKWIEWEKQTTPTAKELNSAREYVKNFDNLENNRRLAITRMIQSAEGKVDKNILKGVANIMAVNPKSDLEFRFADLGGSKRGLTTEIRGKTVIVIDGRADFNKTVKSTIAHELVHYLENRSGYEDFAEYVMKRAKPEAKERIAKKYTDFYRSVFTAEALGVDNKTSFDLDSVPAEVKIEVEERLMSKEMQDLIDSEITASLVGNALQSETFLKRYANRDRKFIAKVGSWLKQITSRLKMTEEQKAEADIANEYSLMVDTILQMPAVKESEGGTKYAEADNKVKAFSKIAVSTALYDALDHKDSGYDNLILMSKMPRFIENKFGISGDLYVYRDHLYENTVSKERAIEDKRPTTIGKKDRHFHNLGEERMIEAIMSIDSPIMSVEVHSKNHNPTVIMALPVLDENGSPLRAVLSFYSDQNINGSFNQKPHIVLTITPSQISESSGARKGWAEFISEAVEEGRVLSYDKEKGSALSVIAQQARLGNITEASLNNSITRFKKFVKEFKEKNKINYDLADNKFDLADNDASYMSAVESGDMETAQRMVDEAARRAGYATPKLYHGTTAFGFTEFDFAKSDDNISVFATTDEGVARTYAEKNPKTSISERVDITPEALDNASDEQILSYLQEYVNEDFRIISTRGRTQAARNTIAEAKDKLTSFINENSDRIEGRKGRFLQQMVSAIETMETANSYKAFYDAYTVYESTIWNLKWEDNELLQDLRPLIVEDLRQSYSILVTTLNDGRTAFTDGNRVLHRLKAITELRPKLFSGVYKLYGKTGRSFVIEGNGANWNQLDGRKIGKYGPVTTRDVVSYASQSGYDSVTFKDIVDKGDVTDGVGESTVYAFLRQGALKSADPVTYDDDGNVILPSQRFNADIADIRYDLADDSADAESLKAENTELKSNIERELYAGTKEIYGYRIKRLYKGTFNGNPPYFVIDNPDGKEILQYGSMNSNIVSRLAEYIADDMSKRGVVPAKESPATSRPHTRSILANALETAAENTELRGEVKKMRGMLEKVAKENALRAKNEKAEIFNKEDVTLAVKSIESWTQDEILSLVKGYELEGMNKLKRENMISQIYIALHEEGARGQTGPGSVAVKLLASKIASEYIDSARIVDENKKSYHISDVYDNESVNRFKIELTDLLYGELSNMGKATPVGEVMARMRQQSETFRREQFNDAKIARYAKEVSYQGLKLRDIAEHQKRDGAAGVSEGLDKVTRALAAAVDPKGNVSAVRIDKAMRAAAKFLDGEDLKLRSERSQLSDEAKVSESADVLNDTLKYMVDEYNRMRAGKDGKALSAEEMKLAGEILRGMKAFVERYNKEYINGHWVDVDQAAADEVKDLIKLVDIEKNKEYKTKIGALLGGKLGKGINEVYFYKILSPEYVLGALEGYSKGGLIQSMYHTIREAQQKSAHLSLQMTKPLIDFIDDKENRWESDGEDGGKKGHKYSFRNKLNTKTISVNGSELTLGEAIYLFMLTKREESHAGLIENGYIVFDENNQKRYTIKLSDIGITRDNIYNQLDKTDIAFLELAESFFNKTASKIKYDADMKIFGYSNNSDGYYVPMIRDRYSRTKGVTDGRFSASEIVSLYSPSFTKNLVSNANALEGKNIMEIITNHANGLADYSEMYLPLKAFDRVYNRGVITDDGVRSIREVLNNNVWNGTETYLKDLFKDIQHQSDSRDNVVDKLVGKIRSGWVSSVLGANIKVVMTQTTSLGAATQVIEPKYIVPALSVVPKFKGETINALRERAYKYSDIIEARVSDMGAIKAQGNVEKIGEIGKKSGILIEKMDEQVCLTIFHAAELKVEALTGHAIGTEENAKRAAKIADEAIFTTQAMTAPAEKSALQRSPSEVAKTLSMFTSDVTKNLSHLWGNTMKYFAHKQRANAGDAEYEAMLKEDAKDMRRSMRTLGITGLMMGLITYLFKWLYAKEEEEPEERAKDFALDIFSSTFNILPIVSDIFDKFVFNYDMSLNVFDMVNDTIGDTANMFKMTGNAMSGKFVSDDEIVRNSSNFIKSIGGVFGVPIAPVERTVTGLLRKFAPSTIYGYNSAMYTTNFTSDLKKAVESGDDRLAEHVIEQMYKDQVNGTYTAEELEEIVRLYSLTDENGRHYNVLPQQIGTTVNDVNLNAKQRKQFRSIYSQASAKVNALIRSAEYKALTDEQRAKAIKNVYALYYNRAASEVTGKEISNAQMYSWLTDNYSALFVSQAYKSGLSAVKDANGEESVRDQFVEYAQNLGLSEGDYLVVAFANGVRDKQTKAAFIEYINSLKLSDEQKATIAEKLSLEIKNGKLSEKKE